MYGTGSLTRSSAADASPRKSSSSAQAHDLTSTHLPAPAVPGLARVLGRTAEQVALHEVAVAALQEVELCLGLHALGDHLHAQRMRERDDGRDDRHLVVVAGHLGDEAAVDLQVVDRE